MSTSDDEEAVVTIENLNEEIKKINIIITELATSNKKLKTKVHQLTNENYNMYDYINNVETPHLK